MTPTISLKALATLAVALPLTYGKPLDNKSLLKRDVPQNFRACATEGDARFQPVIDFDTDGCYNTPAVGADGTLNSGMDPCNTMPEADCRDEADLDNNQVYSRSRCNGDWCAHMYGYYFEKDVAIPNVCSEGVGHRHDWEHIVVWAQSGVVRHVAVSQHGDYKVQNTDAVLFEGERPKIVYNKDSGSTHTFRFAAPEDDNIENHKGVWFRGPLVSWNGYPSEEVRNAMVNNNWGGPAIDFKDDKFAEALEKAKGGDPSNVLITLDTSYDNEFSPGQPQC